MGNRLRVSVRGQNIGMKYIILRRLVERSVTSIIDDQQVIGSVVLANKIGHSFVDLMLGFGFYVYLDGLCGVLEAFSEYCTELYNLA